ncbi:unannotated protein [freshwater metagenome]|uniref:Unannotated protein n=1 Tax=freshwater metagenome TaxID=449393 RepID=A0A6J7EVG8_9ZZZZ
MIIRALADAARHLKTPDDCYQVESTPWALSLSPAGRAVSLVPLELTGADGRATPVRQPVPKVIRTVAVAPQLACDSGIYTFGMADPARQRATYDWAAPGPPELGRHAQWTEMVRDWVASLPSPDPGATALLAWLDAGKPGLAEVMPTSDTDQRALAIGTVAIYAQGDNKPLHRHRSAVRFWQAHVETAKSHSRGLCSSCGSESALVDTFPTGVPKRLVPGAGQATVALTSANFATASRNLSVTQLANAPTCMACALHSVAALIALSEEPSHSWTGDDARTIWWLKCGATPSIFAFLDAPPPADEVHKVFDQVHAGTPLDGLATLDDEYYALTFSGRGPRLIVRSWVDTTLREVALAVDAYFKDSAVARIGHPDRQWQPLWRIARSAGTRRRKSGKVLEEAPDGAHDALLRAALTGSSPPLALLACATARSRAEIGLAADEPNAWWDREHARACLVRLILNRSHQSKGGPDVPGPTLDPDNHDPAYLCGRLFAEYEGLQRSALGSDVNATITDRVYGKAMVSPLMVYPSMDRLGKAHQRKLRTGGNEGAAAAIDHRITALVAAIGPIPAALDVSGQARWMLGYYQQRAASMASAHAAKAAAADTTERRTSPPTEKRKKP